MKSFVVKLLQKRLSLILFAVLTLFVFAFTISKKNDGQQQPLKVEHVIQGYLGPNHLANLVYRKAKSGDKFVGWGRTPMTEWPVGSANKRLVLPALPDKRYSNGGCAIDVDGDGFDEIVTACGSMANLSNASLNWYKETDDHRYWKEHEIASIWPNGYTAPHDVVPYIKTLNTGKNFKAVIVNKARYKLHLFVVPENPEGEWPHFEIGTFPTRNQSGITLADMNSDGNIDLVSGNYWIEAPDDPTDVPWNFHRLSNWDERGENRWGGMNKHAVADFDGDGFPDIVASEAEIPDARLSLFVRENDDGTGMWNEIPLETGLEVPHSLVAADFDNDGKTDFIVGEMTAGGWDFTMNPNPKIYAFMNEGNRSFKESVIYEGWGVHEMRLFPKLYNNKMTVYAADEIQPQKFNNMNTHVSFWMISPP